MARILSYYHRIIHIIYIMIIVVYLYIVIVGDVYTGAITHRKLRRRGHVQPEHVPYCNAYNNSNNNTGIRRATTTKGPKRIWALTSLHINPLKPTRRVCVECKTADYIVRYNNNNNNSTHRYNIYYYTYRLYPYVRASSNVYRRGFRNRGSAIVRENSASNPKHLARVFFFLLRGDVCSTYFSEKRCLRAIDTLCLWLYWSN